MTRPLVIIGAGGHAAVVLDAARASGWEIVGLADADPARQGQCVLDAPVFGGDDAVFAHAPSDVLLMIGIGSTANTALRREIFDRFAAHGYDFATVIHPAAIVARDVTLGAGTVVMAGAIIQTRCRLGSNVIVNTGAQIDHDGTVGDHAHIAPGAVLSGDVTVGDGAHIGVGTTVLQGIAVGETSVCAAGAVVIRNVAGGSTVAGNPAREIE
ncbi:acetyltransferase [Thalassospiraceae bacterium LMO-SO8]|nr:acetyltransferase [Alphaproteobacteria bacterium LMO-S08]WND77693.1 acetyltransferase [Thalassospiraceae bacterium LMO-SO8]